jgi:hypothetical protein
MTIHIATFGGRQVLIGSLSDIPAIDVVSPFAALVAAFCQEERNEVLAVAGLLLELGCKELCCVGFEAEPLHDDLDQLLEDSNRLDVVTTCHKNIVEGCEYFLFGAGAQRLVLYGLISRHPEVMDALTVVSQ